MKSDFHFHFYSRIFIMLILAVSLILIQQSVRSKAEINSFPYEVTGWAWNDSARWFSLNCYNDFITPGDYQDTCNNSVLQWPNNADDYALDVYEDGHLEGCIWSGNNLGGDGSPLGWVCFNDVFSALRDTPLSDLGVATSSTYLNALDPNTFASILSNEDWRCVDGTNDGKRCAPGSTFCSDVGGTCTFTDNQKWKLGFPILKSVGTDDTEYPSTDNPLEGCFNCYENPIYGCLPDSDWYVSDAVDDVYNITKCDPSIPNVCGVNYSCELVHIQTKCDNCLEYFYYPGRCEDNTGAPSATMGCTKFRDGQTDCCTQNDDCESGYTCQPIKTCQYYTTGFGYIDEYECTDATINPNDNDHVCDLLYDTNPCTERKIGSLIKTIGGYDCSICEEESFDNRCYLNADKKNLNSCATCDSLWYNPGVMIDNRHYGWSSNDQTGVVDTADLTPGGTAPDDVAYMCGWAWNGWNESGAVDIYGNLLAENGLFWFQFSPRVVSSTKPFLSVEGGNIYSQKGIVADYLPPFGYYNSSYLIESGGGITNFIASTTLSGLYQGEIPFQSIINFPAPISGGRYSNALGTIDYDGLITAVEGNPLALDDFNKYGSVIETFNDNTFLWQQIMDNKVHYYTNNLYIVNNSESLTFLSGTSDDPDAAGVIVVENNMYINRNIEYQSGGTYSNLRNVPSVVWIIKGDLLIGPDVSELAGTFIVLGDGNNDCDPDSPAYNCGRIDTCHWENEFGSSNACGTNPLIIRGNVLAKYFDLGRTALVDNGVRVPSEQFINDGRLRVNPPNGFLDFSSIIPRFSSN